MLCSRLNLVMSVSECTLNILFLLVEKITEYDNLYGTVTCKHDSRTTTFMAEMFETRTGLG